MSDKMNNEEFARNLYEKKTTYTIIYDADKFNLGQRIRALIKYGFKVGSNPVAHRVEYIDDDGNSTYVEHLCVAIHHPVFILDTYEQFQETIKTKTVEELNHELGIIMGDN